MNSIRRIPTVLRTVGARQLETSSNIQPGYDKIRKAQELFQMNDGKLVFEKTRTDRFLFYLSTGMVVVGTIGCFQYFFSAAFPKKG